MVKCCAGAHFPRTTATPRVLCASPFFAVSKRGGKCVVFRGVCFAAGVFIYFFFHVFFAKVCLLIAFLAAFYMYVYWSLFSATLLFFNMKPAGTTSTRGYIWTRPRKTRILFLRIYACMFLETASASPPGALRRPSGGPPGAPAGSAPRLRLVVLCRATTSAPRPPARGARTAHHGTDAYFTPWGVCMQVQTVWESDSISLRYPRKLKKNTSATTLGFFYRHFDTKFVWQLKKLSFPIKVLSWYRQQCRRHHKKTIDVSCITQLINHPSRHVTTKRFHTKNN